MQRQETPLGCKTLKSTIHSLKTFVPPLKHTTGSAPVSIMITWTRPHLYSKKIWRCIILPPPPLFFSPSLEENIVDTEPKVSACTPETEHKLHNKTPWSPFLSRKQGPCSSEAVLEQAQQQHRFAGWLHGACICSLKTSSSSRLLVLCVPPWPQQNLAVQPCKAEQRILKSHWDTGRWTTEKWRGRRPLKGKTNAQRGGDIQPLNYRTGHAEGNSWCLVQAHEVSRTELQTCSSGRDHSHWASLPEEQG